MLRQAFFFYLILFVLTHAAICCNCRSQTYYHPRQSLQWDSVLPESECVPSQQHLLRSNQSAALALRARAATKRRMKKRQDQWCVGHFSPPPFPC
jgi:hypothetical protein